MRFTVEYPNSKVGYDPDLLAAAGPARMEQAVEAHGYDAIAFGDHPGAPDDLPDGAALPESRTMG